MDCPQCRVPMAPLTQPSFLTRLVAIFLSGAADESPGFRCPKCRTEVTTPLGELTLSIDNLDDYRKSCMSQLSHMLSTKSVMGGFWTETQQSRLGQLERFLRVLDSMTVDERFAPDLPGPAERERLIALSGATNDDLEQLFKEFVETRDLYAGLRQKSFVEKIPPWWALAPVIVLFSLAIGAAVFAQFNTVVAAVMSWLGYYFLSVLVVFLCLTRFKNATALMFSSRFRFALFALVIPAALAATLFLMVHERMVRANLEAVPVIVGSIALCLLVIGLHAWLSTELYLRKVLRGSRVTNPALPVPNDSQNR